MNRFILLSVLLTCILVASCTREEPQADPILRPTTGSISGNISPITVYDAEITVLRDGKMIAVVGVRDGIFQIDNLLPGAYDLRASALGYVTNDALKGVQVAAGEAIDIGRVVIYPEDTGEFVPTRITGTVVDANTRAAISQASIKIECAEGICGILDGVSDPKGRFEIAVWANLASIVKVQKAGYESAWVEVVGIPTGKAQSIWVELKRIGE